MKRSYLFWVFVIMFMLFINVTEVNAMNTSFATKELSEEEKNEFLSHVGIWRLTIEPTKTGINNFDVNEKGMIAISQITDRDKMVCIYSSDGTFLYGYAVECNGVINVEWDGECIIIEFVRSDILVSLDPDGNVVDVQEIQVSDLRNIDADTKMRSTRRVVGDTTYLIRNDMGILSWIASSYSQIVVIDASGTETIIYDVNSIQLAKRVAVIIAAFALVSIAVVKLIFPIFKGAWKTCPENTEENDGGLKSDRYDDTGD